MRESEFAHHAADKSLPLERDTMGKVFKGEHELALGMTQHVLSVIRHVKHG